MHFPIIIGTAAARAVLVAVDQVVARVALLVVLPVAAAVAVAVPPMLVLMPQPT